MGFRPYGVQYFPGFVMNESMLFFEAEQSDLPRQRTNYCLHADGMALMKYYGRALISKWNMPMEIRPVWVGDRTCMYAWLLPRNYGTTLFLDPEFQTRLEDFRKVAHIAGPPKKQPRWLALHTGDLPHTYRGKPWADDEFRSQSIQETPMYTKSCANCDLFDPFVYEEGGEVDEDEDEPDEDGRSNSEKQSDTDDNDSEGDDSEGDEGEKTTGEDRGAAPPITPLV